LPGGVPQKSYPEVCPEYPSALTAACGAKLRKTSASTASARTTSAMTARVAIIVAV
jgi:hypothetical protein